MNKFAPLALLLWMTAPAWAKSSPDSEANADQMMSALADGPPKLAGTVLDPAAYVEEEVQRLAKARIAYVNWRALGEIFRGMGYANPPAVMTPELQKAILDKLGFAKKMSGEKAEFYRNEFRKLYSIRYGGHWINYNFGSGRNGAGGMVDIKGIGKTVLVRPWADGGHANGLVTVSEALKEAIWSNILHEELPLGANRVLFIITTGTLTFPDDPKSEARALIVREDMVRPAYFQQNLAVDSENMSEENRKFHGEADALRMKRLLPKLLKALPRPKNVNPAWSKKEHLHAAFIEMVDRVTLQYAKAHVNQILLSGTSTSNTQIDGTALDYGATSALLGFSRISYLNGEAENGSTASLKSDLFLEMTEDLRKVLPRAMASGLPSDKEIEERIDQQYRTHVARGFLELAGVPPEFSPALMTTDAGRALSETLMKIAYAGNEEPTQWAVDYGFKPTGTYDLEKVLSALVAGPRAGFNRYALAEALPNQKLREQLQRDFAAAFSRLSLLAKAEGISVINLRKYMSLAVPARNRPMRDLIANYRIGIMMRQVSDAYSAGNQNMIQEYADAKFEREVREFKGKPFELVLKTKKDLAAGFVTRTHFNLKSGELRQMSQLSPKLSCEEELKK